MQTQRSVRIWSTIATASTLILLAGVMVLGYLAFQTHGALCAFKEDLERRADATRAVLEADPQADPIRYFGLVIPRSDLESDLRNRERTLQSLSSIRWCETP